MVKIKKDNELFDKGSFMWAVQEMKKGNNVRRKSWKNKDIYCYASGETIFYWDCEEASLEVFEIEATDWEVYKVKEKKKTLSDNIFYAEDYVEEVYIGRLFKFDDVKDFIKTIKKEIREGPLSNHDIEAINSIIDDAAGDKLTK